MGNTIFRKLYVFSRRKYRVFFKKKYSQRDIDLLKNKNFVIVSDNCWGAEIYKWLNRPYNTPFVGLWIYGECYLKLLANFDYYMSQKISFSNISKYPSNNSTYPIGMLEDLEIHFLHYKNENEARVKWERRVKRMFQEKNRDNFYFKLCDGGNTTKEHFKKFHSLSFKNKISFSIKNYSDLKLSNHFLIYEREKKHKNQIPNGVKLFKLTFLYLDLYKWMKKTLTS